MLEFFLFQILKNHLIGQEFHLSWLAKRIISNNDKEQLSQFLTVLEENPTIKEAHPTEYSKISELLAQDNEQSESVAA